MKTLYSVTHSFSHYFFLSLDQNIFIQALSWAQQLKWQENRPSPSLIGLTFWWEIQTLNKSHPNIILQTGVHALKYRILWKHRAWDPNVTRGSDKASLENYIHIEVSCLIIVTNHLLWSFHKTTRAPCEALIGEINRTIKDNIMTQWSKQRAGVWEVR